MTFNPAKEAISVFKGSTFSETLTWQTEDDAGVRTNVNLTGYTARLIVRKDYASAPVIDLANGSGITLGGTAGTIDINITAAQTERLPVMTGVYDLELYALTGSGVPQTYKLIHGTFTVRQEATY